MHIFLAAIKGEVPAEFPGVQTELDTEEYFLSCAQHEKETLSNFYRRFL
jgi:hypothetical protein